MIIGSCPYKGCDEPLMLDHGDAPLPAYHRHKCTGCKKFIWTKFSRIDPCSWTERNFLKEYKVDKKTKQIELKNPPKPLTPKELLWQELYNTMMRKYMNHYLIYGYYPEIDKKDVESLFKL